MAGYLSSNRVFETSDIDEANLFVNQIWEKQKSTLVKGAYGLRWNHIELDRCGLTYAEHDCYCDLRAQGPLSDQFRIYFHLEGAIEHTVGRRVLVSNAQNVAIHVPGADLTARIGPFRFLEASLNGAFVRTALKQRFRKIPAPEDWVGALPHSAAAATLRGAVEWMAVEIERPGSPLAKAGKPLLHAERMLLSLFVECLAEAAPAEIDGARSISEMQARMAEEWIEANIAEPIGVEEVANAVGVGVRSLQLSFQRARGYSPTQAIYQLRLDRARKALLSARPGETVTSIVADLGIFELGRFAKKYRERFGETPSQTLMRQKP